jgi:hypothetical protein
MFLTRSNAGAVVLLASCTMASLATRATERAQARRDDRCRIVALADLAGGDPGTPQAPAAAAAARAEKPPEAGGDGGVRSKGHIFTPVGKPVYVNVYSTDPDADRKDLVNFANDVVMPRLGRIEGMDVPRNVANRISALRIRLDPDRMRAHNLSSDDIKKALSESSMIRPGERPARKTWQSKEDELIHIGGRYTKPEQWENIILRASPDGEILRLKEVGRVELAPPFFDVSSDIDGHPATAIVLKPSPGAPPSPSMGSRRTSGS